jgi:hypothetical protein
VASRESAAAIRSAISLRTGRGGGDCGESCLFVLPEEAPLVLLCPILGTRFYVGRQCIKILLFIRTFILN